MSPGGLLTPLERLESQCWCFGKPAEEALGWVAHPNVHCKMDRCAAGAGAKRGSQLQRSSCRSLGGDGSAAGVGGRLVSQTGQALALAEHREHVEDRG